MSSLPRVTADARNPIYLATSPTPRRTMPLPT